MALSFRPNACEWAIIVLSRMHRYLKDRLNTILNMLKNNGNFEALNILKMFGKKHSRKVFI